jgi:NADH-quinone oxidoreductase subunit A
MAPLAAYVLIFLAVGAAFILVNLLVGKLIRPARPQSEKLTIYECGEPTIGSAWVQFDLRFYVVALLFVIFDVEVAFFFPWAVVFGRANDVADVASANDAQAYAAVADRAMELVPPYLRERPEVQRDYHILKGYDPQRRQELDQRRAQLNDAEKVERANLVAAPQVAERIAHQARTLGWLAFWEILFFFGILLVGFAYLWQRGDLAWVRSLSERQAAALRPSPLAAEQEQELVGAGR